LTRPDQIGHPQPALAIDLGVQLAFGLMHQRVVFGEIRAGGRRLSDAELVCEITRNFLCFIGADPKPAPAATGDAERGLAAPDDDGIRKPPPQRSHP